jgi:hypothetical protein
MAKIYTKERALSDYYAELSYCLGRKAEGLERGVGDKPIDECIKFWEDGIVGLTALPAGGSAEAFNY